MTRIIVHPEKSNKTESATENNYDKKKRLIQCRKMTGVFKVRQ
jgi:hypothetical protein